jgi:hypothetical protein
VLFKPPDDEDDDALIEVLMKGRLAKKSPKGLPGVHVWQTRWFELQPSHLAYWELNKMEGAVKKGSLFLGDMVGVRVAQKEPRRFDLLLKSGRMFELRAESNAERDVWCTKLQDALVQVAAKEGGRGEREASGVAAPPSSLRSDLESATSFREEPDQQVIEEEELTAGMRTMSLQSRSVKKAGTATSGNLVAAPVIVQAQYMSRVQRARLANAARRMTAETPPKLAPAPKPADIS